MKENSREDRVNILKIECYITINDEKEPILNIGTSFSNMIESEEFKDYNDELHKNIKPVLNDLKQMLLNTLEDEDIQYYKKEIQSIKNIVDNYLKEKARADKLEKEYSAMLTELDENECDYKRVLKENEELKSKNKTLEELLQGNLYELYKYYKELAGTYQGNCIPVQEVKDKIEELKQEKKKYGNCLIEMYEDELVNRDIKILRELLEGRK